MCTVLTCASWSLLSHVLTDGYSRILQVGVVMEVLQVLSGTCLPVPARSSGSSFNARPQINNLPRRTSRQSLSEQNFPNQLSQGDNAQYFDVQDQVINPTTP